MRLMRASRTIRSTPFSRMYPSPPKIWSVSSAICQRPSEQNSLEMVVSIIRSGSCRSTRPAQRYVIASIAKVVWAILAIFSRMSWNSLIDRLNCRRFLACLTVASSASLAPPTQPALRVQRP